MHLLYSLRRLQQLIVRTLTLGRLRLRGVELLGPGVVEFAKLSVKDGSLELSSSSGLHFARGVKERTVETRKPTIATNPRAVGKGVVNEVIHLTTSCMVPVIAIIALNSFLVEFDRFITHCTRTFHTWTRIERDVTTQKQQGRERGELRKRLRAFVNGLCHFRDT